MKGAPKVRLLRKTLGWCLLAFGCLSIFFLDRVDIVMNASTSLEDPAYLMLEHPVALTKGAVIAAEMPEPLKAKFDGFQYVKVIRGLPGDEITLDGAGNPCINAFECFPLSRENGEPISPAIKPGVIPANHFAVFGTSDDSLDSRYAAIGLVHKDELIGRGIALPWVPDWRK